MISLAASAGSVSSTDSGATTPLRVVVPKVALSLDPHKMEDAYSMAVVVQLYRGLLRYTPEGNVLPDLAASWTESPDHLRFVFRLREATFSDGTKITAKHVQMSFARMFSLGASMGADIDYIEGAKRFRGSGDLSQLGIKPLSESEIEFRLVHSTALFLKHLAVADCAILPLSGYRDALLVSETTPFSGPYRIRGAIRDGGVELEKWRTDPLDSPNPPQKIQFLTTNDDPRTLAETDRADSVDHAPLPTEARQALLAKGWQPSPTEIIWETFVILNPTRIDAKLRRLLASKVQTTEVVKLLGDVSNFQPAFGLIPYGVKGELKAPSPAIDTPTEPQTTGNNRVALEFEDGDPVQVTVAQYLSRIWSKAGVAVTLKPLSKQEKLQRMFAKQCEACIGQKGLDYPDGFSVLTYFKSGYPANYFHVADPAIDRDIDCAALLLKDADRTKAYQQIQIKILKHHTVVPLFFGTRASGLWGPKVKVVPSHPMGIHTLPLETVEMR